MRFSVRRPPAATPPPPAPAPTPAFEPTLDLARFHQLIEAGERLRHAGLAYEDVELRAIAEEVSWNRALEIMAREHDDA